jgi:hypothetical protein
MLLNDKTEVISGLVLDEYVNTTPMVVIDGNEKIKIVKSKPFIDKRWATFWLTTKSIILVDNRNSRKFVFRTISRALVNKDKYIDYVHVNIEKIAEDHRGHWLGQIKDRKGHMQNATLHGDHLEDDDVIGSEYVRSHKNQVGFETDYFGTPTRVKVTRGGTVMVLTDLNNRMEEYIQYIKENLLSYFS